MHPAHRLRLAALDGFEILERLFDAAFGSDLNPLRHLGALACLLLIVLAASGCYLYALFDTSVSAAYPSVERISALPWYQGGVLRSLHRYAADAFVVVMLVHLLREALMGRYRGFRRVTWLTGVPLVAFAFISAIGGFWLCWDELGLYSAQASAELLDRLPLFGAPLVRNFLTVGAVSDRLFSLLVFVHIGVSLMMLFGLWFHLQRIARADVIPPARLGLGVLGVLLALALIQPVLSHPAADPAMVPARLALDWLLLFIHPLAEAVSPDIVLAGVGAAFGLLFALPWLPASGRAGPMPAARVDPDHCNGCRRCFDDCPYAAVTMAPHPLRPAHELAVVDADLCAGCGICAGACPSSTPFRHADELVSGIDIPGSTVGLWRERLSTLLAQARERAATQVIVVFGCDRGADLARLADGRTLCLSLLCAGQLPPSFVDYALRDGAAGVLVTGCRGGACEYRLGERWTRERLSGAREPHLRASVERPRVVYAAAGAGDEALLRRALADLRRDLPREPAVSPAPSGEHRV